jgi:hypothetical protein
MLLTSRSFATGGYPEFWMAVLMVLITVALQFSSTVLLSDLHNFVIVGDYNRTQVPGLVHYDKEDFNLALISSEYFLRRPVFVTFGEVQSGTDSSPKDNGLSDTGLIQRGFLPFSDSQNRTSVRRYDGNAMVMSSRAACMRPVLHEGHVYTYDSGNYENNGVLEGQLEYASSFEQAGVDALSPCGPGECEGEPFTCGIPSSAFGDWESGACLLSRFETSPRGLSLKPHWNPSDGAAWSANSSAYFVFTTNMRAKDWAKTLEPVKISKGDPYEEWQSYEIMPGRFLNLTLCFMGVGLERMSVKMNSSAGTHEPSMSRSVISKKYDTADVRNLFGIDSPSRHAVDRGTLSMTIVGKPDDGPASGRAYQTITVGDASNITIANFSSAIMELVLYAVVLEAVVDNGTLSFCSACSLASAMELDTNLSLVLNDIITKSGRAANALTTFLTIAASAVYYDYIGALVDFQEAGTISTTVVLVPGQCAEYSCQGFIGVATLLGAHLVYVTVITVLYIRQIRFSRYGNIWYTTSQLVSGELQEVREQTNKLSDKAMRNFFEKENKNDFLTLGHLDESGQIGFLKTSVPTISRAAPDLASPSLLGRLTMLKDKMRGRGWKNKEER